MATTPAHYRPPEPLKITGSDVADNWRRFRDQWQNYVVAVDLTDATTEKQAAVFLTCIGTEAYDVYRAMHFDSEEDRKKIESIIAGFEAFCVGAVNTTYERYRFNQRTQNVGERFDVYLGEIRRMAKSCNFAAVENSMLRDRIVVGIKDDATRRKLLQVRELTLDQAIDLCKASEAAGRQLKEMATPEAVQPLQHTKPTSQRRGRGRGARPAGEQRRRGTSATRRDRDYSVDQRSCRYCGRHHDANKQACPAYGQTCTKCRKLHHFAAVCRSSSATTTPRQQHVREIDDHAVESLLALHEGTKRVYSNVLVNDVKVRFLLDCGSTVNILPRSIANKVGHGQAQLRPARATLRMFNATELPTDGMTTVTVKHPRTGDRFECDFYVTEREQPILGMEACRRLNLLHIVEENICETHEATPPGGLTTADVFTRYQDLFDGSLGCMDGEVSLAVDSNVPPVQMPLRRLPVALRDQVQTELAKLVTNGVIAPVTEPSSWVSALLVVQKPEGQGVRIVMDPKFLNTALQRSTYYMQTIDDVLPNLNNVKVMSTVDMRQAFWMLKLDRESSMLTTFETPFGRYRWLRLPMGLSVSPEIFASRIQAALSGLKGVHCIADDILVTGAGDDVTSAMRDHDANMLALLERCRQKGIKLNKQKFDMHRSESVSFMGFRLTPQGLAVDTRKTDAIMNMPRPENRAALQRLLGLATFVARFCPNFSEITAPLRQLLARENEFLWDARHSEALAKLKELLTTPPVLGYYSPTQTVVIQGDASTYALGAACMQNGRVIEYASRALTETEQRYAQIERELLSLVFALERFHTYVYARRDVVVQTDHKPLLAINKKALASAPKRLQRMLLRLQRYSFDLEYVPGSNLTLADTLSRAPEPTANLSRDCRELAALGEEQHSDLQLIASQPTINAIRAAAADDPIYQRLKQQIMSGWPPTQTELEPDLQPYFTYRDELAVSGDFVFKGHRVVIPVGYREQILQRLHASHIGINSCLRRARETVFFPGITAAVKKLISACAICVRLQAEIQKEPLLSHEPPSRPWEKVGVDLFNFRGQDYCILVDYLTNYFEIDRLPSKKVTDIIYCLKQHFARMGIPNTVFSDNSPFLCHEFQAFAAKYEFEHRTSSPRNPQSNGKVENAVKTVKRLMTKACESGSDPFLALLDWRNCPSADLGQSPVQLLMGRRTRTTLPTANSLLATPSASATKAALTNAKCRQAVYYNRNAKPRAVLPVGQTVRMRYDEGDWRKAEVARILPSRSYQLRMEDGTMRRRTSRHVRFSSEPPLMPPDDSGNATLTERTPPPPPPPPVAPSPPPAVVNHELPSSTNQASLQADTAIAAPKSQSPIKTRSGRTVRRPARFSD